MVGRAVALQRNRVAVASREMTRVVIWVLPGIFFFADARGMLAR
jgi:hypothetical protein